MLETSLMHLASPELLKWKAVNEAEQEALGFSSLSAGKGACGAPLRPSTWVEGWDVAEQEEEEEEEDAATHRDHAAGSRQPRAAIASLERAGQGWSCVSAGLCWAWASRTGCGSEGWG